MGKYALLIGVGEYQDGLHPLPAAPNDVAALKAVLENPKLGGFDEVRSVINPGHAMMAREIELWFQGRRPEDLVLLFFSGHGVKDDRRDLFFAAQDTEKNRDRLIRSTATSARFVNDCIRGCRAKYQVVILDCCFSGAFGEMVPRDDGHVDLESQLGAEGRVVLTSTSAVDYSFEEKDENLSIYTRYLVEGIVTGAADEDGDGIITVENLHRYAGRKVEEISPAMSPKIIVLKDEGYRIQLARSAQNDPKLRYRKEVDRRAKGGSFSVAARRILDHLREELGIHLEEAAAIEAEVIQPYQEYQRKQQVYATALRDCLQDEDGLSESTVQDLIDLRFQLHLNPDDVSEAEKQILDGLTLSEYILRDAFVTDPVQPSDSMAEPALWQPVVRQDEADEIAVFPRPESRPTATETQAEDLTSEIFVGDVYARLQGFLVEGNWAKADQETEHRMLELVNRQNAMMRLEDIPKLPAKDLHNIDALWVIHSQGQFGFSVQKALWESFREPIKYGSAWDNFGKSLGWRKEKTLVARGLDWFIKNASPLEAYDWIDLNEVQFYRFAPKGHLPIGPFKVGSILHYSFLSSLSLDDFR